MSMAKGLAVGFCVLYRWELRPGLEAQFVSAWEQATRALMRHRGALGSRLHRAEDGTWYAYAQWPSRAAWQAHRSSGPIDSDLADLMREAEAKAFAPILLEPAADHLRCTGCGAMLAEQQPFAD